MTIDKSVRLTNTLDRGVQVAQGRLFRPMFMKHVSHRLLKLDIKRIIPYGLVSNSYLWLLDIGRAHFVRHFEFRTCRD